MELDSRILRRNTHHVRNSQQRKDERLQSVGEQRLQVLEAHDRSLQDRARGSWLIDARVV